MTPEDAARLVVDVADRTLTLAMTGGTSLSVPVGPLSLFERELGGADTPSAVQLTNALGTVHDHLDDVFIAAPTMLAPSSVVARGAHATGIARVELGTESVPSGYRLRRSDADEVFRTVATEDRSTRTHNPGLVGSQIDSIVGTCCVILGLMRRLGLDEIGIESSPTSSGSEPTNPSVDTGRNDTGQIAPPSGSVR